MMDQFLSFFNLIFHWYILVPVAILILLIFLYFFFIRKTFEQTVAEISDRFKSALDIEFQTYILPNKEFINIITTAQQSLGVEEDIDPAVIFNAIAYESENGRFILLPESLKKLTYAELCFIIGHEVGHFYLGHTKPSLFNKIMEHPVTYFLRAFLLGYEPISGSVINVFLSALKRWHRKDMEYMADEFSVECLKSLGLPHTGWKKFFERISYLENKYPWYEKVISFIFGSHPSAKARIKNLQTMFPEF